MAQSLSHAVLREIPLRSLSPSSCAGHLRWKSSRAGGRMAQVFELVVEAAAEGGGAAETSESTAAARRLDEVINWIVVRRSAPEWLPFVPGSSYWVPPRMKLVEALEKMSSPMSDEEVMSLTTAWGWPCSSHLLADEKPGSPRAAGDAEES